jgi:hypothetical protein
VATSPLYTTYLMVEVFTLLGNEGKRKLALLLERLGQEVVESVENGNSASQVYGHVDKWVESCHRRSNVPDWLKENEGLKGGNL